MHILLDYLLMTDVSHHIILIEADILKGIALYRLSCNGSKIAVIPCVLASVSHLRYTEYKAVIHSVKAAEPAFNEMDKVNYFLPVIKAGYDHENICGQAAEGLLRGADNVHGIIKKANKLVPCIISIGLINELEPFNVKLNKCDPLIGIFLN